jgi:hypothetical protein
MPTPPPEIAIEVAEEVVQAWLIARLTPAWPAANTNIAMELPTTEVWPFIRLNRSGGVSESYVDHVNMTLEVWGDKGSELQTMWMAKQIVAQVPTLYGNVATNAWVVNAHIITGPFSSQDPDTLQPRQLLELSFDLYHV